MTTRILREQDVAEVMAAVGLDRFMDELIERLSSSFRQHDHEVVETVARAGFRYTKPDLGLVEWMPAMVVGSTVSIKTVAYHPSNPLERGAPSVLASTTLHDTTDGRLLAMCDASLLTAVRTGAASAVATDLLARTGPATVGVIGCGAQAVTQLHAISRVRPIERVAAFDTLTDVAETLADRLATVGLVVPIDIVDEPERTVGDADVLVTATSVPPGDGPVVPAAPHRPWLHVNAVGADLPGKYELPLDWLREASIVPDLVEQCLVEGELQRLGPDAVAADICQVARRDEARLAPERERLTVYDSTGWALQDLVAAEHVIEHAARLGIGLELDFQPRPHDPYDPYEFLRR